MSLIERSERQSEREGEDKDGAERKKEMSLAMAFISRGLTDMEGRAAGLGERVGERDYRRLGRCD